MPTRTLAAVALLAAFAGGQVQANEEDMQYDGKDTQLERQAENSPSVGDALVDDADEMHMEKHNQLEDRPGDSPGTSTGTGGTGGSGSGGGGGN